MGRKRKVHIGPTPIGGHELKSRKLARTVTAQYHIIQNERSTVVNNKQISEQEKKNKLAVLQHQMDQIGGTNRYQQASIISTQHFKTSKWVTQTLQDLGKKDNTTKLNLLEVGAINIQLQQYSWLNVKAIDLNSQHPLIEECDFFSLVPNKNFDVVVCSMVLNCVDEPVKRGEMLGRLSCHLVPEHGILLLVLPSRCVNSKHVGRVDMFVELLRGFGLNEIAERRITPKLTFFVLGNNLKDKTSVVQIDVKLKGNEKNVVSSSLFVTNDGTTNSLAINKTKETKKASAGITLNNVAEKFISSGNHLVIDNAIDNINISSHCNSTDKNEKQVDESDNHQSSWVKQVRCNIRNHPLVIQYYKQDFSLVPPNEFCIALPTYYYS